MNSIGGAWMVYMFFKFCLSFYRTRIVFIKYISTKAPNFKFAAPEFSALNNI